MGEGVLLQFPPEVLVVEPWNRSYLDGNIAIKATSSPLVSKVLAQLFWRQSYVQSAPGTENKTQAIARNDVTKTTQLLQR